MRLYSRGGSGRGPALLCVLREPHIDALDVGADQVQLPVHHVRVRSPPSFQLLRQLLLDVAQALSQLLKADLVGGLELQSLPVVCTGVPVFFEGGASSGSARVRLDSGVALDRSRTVADRLSVALQLEVDAGAVRVEHRVAWIESNSTRIVKQSRDEVFFLECLVAPLLGLHGAGGEVLGRVGGEVFGAAESIEFVSILPEGLPHGYEGGDVGEVDFVARRLEVTQNTGVGRAPAGTLRLSHECVDGGALEPDHLGSRGALTQPRDDDPEAGAAQLR
mmetsp:Transcript_7733/g.32571  ORF Transcript_7733/g.32571 Transcript_7733/m.32571 type:complete len:277 (+) Transcript_7733:655-1485(+)